ncbi:MAG: DUF6790 family protein [Rhodoferax sp.]
MSRLIALSGMFIGAVGIFFGFYFLGNDPHRALAIVTTTTVGLVGVLAFVRHFIFHKADARRMGWETDRPEWAYEVGFANLAFGVMGFVSVFTNLGLQAQALTILGYAVYLMQAALLHGYQYFKGDSKSAEKLWRVVIGTASFAAMMLFFALFALLGPTAIA